METNNLDTIKEGYKKRHKRRDFGSGPQAIGKVKCPICPKGHFWRYSDGRFGKCDCCGFNGVRP